MEFGEKEVTFTYSEDLDIETRRIRHLQEVVKYEVPVKIKTQQFNLITKILRVGKTAKGDMVIVMKEPENPKWREYIKPDTPYEIEYQDSAAKYIFVTNFLGAVRDGVVFSFPQEIRRIGRGLHRVKPDPKEPIFVEVEMGGKRFSGSCLDINEQGMGCEVQSPKDLFKVGDVVLVVFSLPTSESQLGRRELWQVLSLKADVRFVGSSGADKTKLGLEFKDLDDVRKGIIREYWLLRQRQEARKTRELE